jgi:hypothetical protein
MPIMSMMSETRIQHVSQLALLCARHRLSSSSATKVKITKRDIRVAILLCDSNCALQLINTVDVPEPY